MHRAFPGEMTSAEAVEYLNQFLVEPISRDYFSQVRAWLGAPKSRQGTSRLWFDRSDLDAFLSEYGRDPDAWVAPAPS